MLYLLAYISRAKVTFTSEMLDEIASVSNANNSRLNVSGVLFLNGNYFFQVLEGREDIVKDLYEKICKDSRHYEHRIIVECATDQRYFTEWFMRCYNLEDYYDVNVSNFRKRLSTAIGRSVNKMEDVVELIKGFQQLRLDSI